MNNHYLLPNLNTFIGYAELSFIKSLMIEQWDLVTCALNYYAKGQDIAYEAYWQSYMSVLTTDLKNPDNYKLAKSISTNIVSHRMNVDAIYAYIRNTYCSLLQQQGVPSQQFNNITGISHGENYFCIEIMDGTVQ